MLYNFQAWVRRWRSSGFSPGAAIFLALVYNGPRNIFKYIQLYKYISANQMQSYEAI